VEINGECWEKILFFFDWNRKECGKFLRTFSQVWWDPFRFHQGWRSWCNSSGGLLGTVRGIRKGLERFIHYYQKGTLFKAGFASENIGSLWSLKNSWAFWTCWLECNSSKCQCQSTTCTQLGTVVLSLSYGYFIRNALAAWEWHPLV
jgi:hypothetical protein